MKILVISASTRVGKLSHFVALEIQKRFDHALHEVNLLDLAEAKLPVMDYLLDSHPNPPENLKAVKTQLDAAEAMIFVSPEYNGGYAPALKNMVDYMQKKQFERKIIAISSVSSGALSGMRGALQLQQLILALFAYPIPQMLLVPEVQKLFDTQGQLLSENFGKKIDSFLKDFLWMAEALQARKQI